MKIGFDAKRYYHNQTGLGNYSRTIVAAVKGQHADIEAVLYDEKALSRTFSLGRKAKAEGCNLFHGLSNELPRDVVRAGLPSIVTIHDVAWRTFPGMYKPIDRVLYDWKYGHSAKIATHVVAISESTKRDVMRFYGVPEERISVIYQPVQQIYYNTITPKRAADIIAAHPTLRDIPPLNSSQQPQQLRFFLTVGSINSRKNLLGMLKAFNEIPSGEKIPFLVVGNGREYRRTCEEYIREKGLSAWVTILDDIHDAETLQALYTLATILLYPSFYEGFGLPVAEAALQYCPVITSNISSLPEAAGPGAIIADPYSTDDITAAMLQLLRNTTQREQLGKAGHDYALSHFNPDTLTQQLYDLYQHVAAL